MKGAIFDVDGTILDSMEAWIIAGADVLSKFGIAFSEEKTHEIQSLRLEQSLPILIKEYNIPLTVEEIIVKMKHKVEDEYRYTIQAKPYVKEYLAKLHSEGVKIAVATSGYPELCQSAFKRIGIFDYIDEYAFSHEVGKGKDSPDIYLLAAERIGVSPEDCVVYEDIPLGIQGAKKGGFATCAIYDSSNAPDTEALKQLADHYITGWKDLL